MKHVDGAVAIWTDPSTTGFENHVESHEYLTKSWSRHLPPSKMWVGKSNSSSAETSRVFGTVYRAFLPISLGRGESSVSLVQAINLEKVQPAKRAAKILT